MTNQNLIHIKIGYEDALKAKKNILSSEMNLIRISKKVKAYRSLRIEELKFKLKLIKKIKEAKTNIGKLKRTLPKLEIPEILKEKEEESIEIEKLKSKIKKSSHDKNLEIELQEIQDKLRSLQ